MTDQKLLTPITICFACDEKYARYVGVVIQSIFENAEHDDQHEFHIITSGLSQHSEVNLQALVEKRSSLAIHTVDLKPLQGFPETSHPISAYLRLLIPSVLPDLDKVLYLDADLIVLNSLKNLWNYSLDQSPIAAAVDSLSIFGNNALFFQSLQLSSDHSYFNSGVMLLNLKKLREMNFLHKFQVWIKENKYLMIHSDQDALNAIFSTNIQRIHLRWNVQVPLIYPVKFGWGCTQEQAEAIANPAIIHYVTKKKPWFRQYKLPYQHLYFKYLKQTPWKDDPMPSFTFAHKLNRLSEEVDWFYKWVRSEVRRFLGRHPKPVKDSVLTN